MLPILPQQFLKQNYMNIGFIFTDRKVQYVSSEKSIASLLVQNYHTLSKQKKDLILNIVGDVHCKKLMLFTSINMYIVTLLHLLWGFFLCTFASKHVNYM